MSVNERDRGGRKRILISSRILPSRIQHVRGGEEGKKKLDGVKCQVWCVMEED